MLDMAWLGHTMDSGVSFFSYKIVLLDMLGYWHTSHFEVSGYNSAQISTLYVV